MRREVSPNNRKSKAAFERYVATLDKKFGK